MPTATRPIPGELETRAAPAIAPTLDGRRLRGVIPYGVASRDLGGWHEVMDPGCLSGADLSALICTVDHAGVPLGRHPRTLEIDDTPGRLGWSVELPESRADVREAIERGDLQSCSWRMVVARDRWEGNTRHIEAVSELRDVSIVSTPAYPAATAELRHHEGEPMPAPAAPETRNDPPPTRGTLRAEDRTADPGPVESRIIEAMRGIPRGEARALTDADASTGLVTSDEVSTFIWDRLRPASVVLASGIRVITTDREGVKWPTITADMTAAFYDELEEITASDPAFGELEVKPKAIKTLARGSSEAFEDSSPDLLNLLQSHIATVLALKQDRELLFGSDPKGFEGMMTIAGTQTIDATGMTNWDPVLQAVGALAGANVPGPYAMIAHPWALTGLSLVKETAGSNVSLGVPEGVPTRYLTSQLAVATGTSTALVYAPGLIGLVRRRDITIEVDRSQEFTSDAVLVRGKLRSAPAFPYPQAIVKLTNVPTADPTLAPAVAKTSSKS